MESEQDFLSKWLIQCHTLIFRDPIVDIVCGERQVEACKYLEGTGHIYWLSFREQETDAIVQIEMSESFINILYT